ncbi:rootletin-like isoform X2 [Sycon ciliatum]|uniref:rootletin-like isoform X2 n=1 Tax=Sycon ciliatum TaxID=27933 RepID=UPI0031F63305
MLQPDVTTASFGEEEQLDEDEEREKQAELQSFLNAASEEAGNLWDASFSTLGDDGQERDFDFEREQAIMAEVGQPSAFGEQYLSRHQQHHQHRSVVPAPTAVAAPSAARTAGNGQPSDANHIAGNHRLAVSPPTLAGVRHPGHVEPLAARQQQQQQQPLRLHHQQHHAATQRPQQHPPPQHQQQQQQNHDKLQRSSSSHSSLGRSPPHTHSLPGAPVDAPGVYANLADIHASSQHHQPQAQAHHQQMVHPSSNGQHHPAWNDLATSSSDYQLSQLSNQLAQCQQENQQLQQKLLTVQQDSEKQQRISHHYLELQKQETASTQSQLDHIRSRTSELESENRTLRQQLSDSATASERAMQEKADAVEQVQSLKSNISALQVELHQVSSSQSLTRLKEEHEKHVEQLREQQKTDLSYQRQLVDSINTKLVKEQGSVHRLEAEVAVLNSEIQQLRLERDRALRSASDQSERTGHAALSQEAADARTACRLAERHCHEFKAELEAVREQLRSLPCWQSDDEDGAGVTGMNGVVGSLMVTPGILQHSTPMATSIDSRPQGSCRDLIALLSLKMKRLMNNMSTQSKSSAPVTTLDTARLDQKMHEISDLRHQLSQVEGDRDKLLAKNNKLETDHSNSLIVEAELKSKIEALQQDLRMQWQNFEEDKKNSIESFYTQLMDLHGNSSQRLKERMQMVSSAERQKLLLAHAEELSTVRSELLASQSEASRVKEEFIRLSETCQKDKSSFQDQAKSHHATLESLRQSHSTTLQQIDERHRKELASQLAALRDQHSKDLEASSESRVSLMEAQVRQMTDFDSVLSSRLSEQERRLQGRHEEAMREMQQQMESLRIAAGSGLCSEEMLGKMRTRLVDELQREREAIIRPALEHARQQWSEEQQQLLVKLENEAAAQRLALLQQLKDKPKVTSEASTQTENGPVLTTMNKHLTQHLMKIAVDLFHDCIREWETRHRTSH